jgi:hypothetical protein
LGRIIAVLQREIPKGKVIYSKPLPATSSFDFQRGGGPTPFERLYRVAVAPLKNKRKEEG